MEAVYTANVKCVGDTEELCLEFPDELMEKMGWKVGDDLKFVDLKNGSFSIKKVNYETIELEFDDEELFKYMQIAHEKDMSFSEFIESTLNKMKNLSNMRTNKNIILGVDGGVNLNTIERIYKTNIDITIVGSALFHVDDICARYNELIDDKSINV